METLTQNIDERSCTNNELRSTNTSLFKKAKETMRIMKETHAHYEWAAEAHKKSEHTYNRVLKILRETDAD